MSLDAQVTFLLIAMPIVAIAQAIFIFWPDDGYGRYSHIRLRMRRSLLASWQKQWDWIIRLLRRWF